MKINIGDYVRVKHKNYNTKIAKILKVLEKDSCYYNMQMYTIDNFVQHPGCYTSNKIYEEDIIKSSSNIIDIVEVRRFS